MPNERKRGVTYSAYLHLAVLVLAIWGLPELFNSRPPEEPAAITVELLPISSVSNVKPSEKQIPKESQEKPKEQAKPSPPVVTQESKPSPPPPPKEKPDAKKSPEPEKPKEKPKKEKPKEEDLSAVLKAVKETAQKEKDKDKNKKDKDSGSKSVSDTYDPTLPMTISEKDAIRSQFAKCWSVPAGAKDAHELIVTLRVEMEQDGTVRSVELASSSKSRYNTDTFFRAAADSAIRAVKMCSPLKNLPPDKYGTWRDMELTFDPKEMLY